MNDGAINLFLAGPAILLLVLASLAAFLLMLMAAGRLAALMTLVARTATRRMQGRLQPIVWGLASELLLAALAAVLFRTKVLALLGLVVLFLGAALAGLGACLAARRAGRALLAAVGETEELDALCSFLVGLLSLLLAAFVPFVGWAVVLTAAASGVGVVLEAAFRRDEGPPLTPS
jgi:hypothetical protein